jgi:PST family polysaccharide transporter
VAQQGSHAAGSSINFGSIASTLRTRIKQIAAASAGPAGNAFWLGADRALRIGLSFIVGILVVRHLGPTGTGVLQSGLALAALFALGVELGLDGVLRREIVRTPERTGALLGSATLMRAAVLVPAVALFAIAYAHQGTGTPSLGLWVGITLALPLAQTAEVWFLATGRVRTSVLAQGITFILVSALRVALVLAGAAVAAFGAAAAAETLLIGLALGLAFWRCTTAPRTWSWDAALARKMMRDATPLLLTNLAVFIYRRFDLLIVANLLDARAAGFYAAAVRMSELGYVAPMLLLNAWFPLITRLHAEDPVAYRATLSDFYRKIVWAGAAFALVVTFSAHGLVRILLGRAFDGAAVPLAIHAWTAVFIAYGIARSQWLLLEDRLFDGLWLACAGAIANLLLNFALIPVLGVNGAALAAIVALALNMGVFPALSKRTRPGWVLGWRAVLGLGPSNETAKTDRI